MASTYSPSMARTDSKPVRPAPYYNYRSLPVGSIRLVRVEARSTTRQHRVFGLDNHIRISMHEYQLASCPRFTALSYTWGEPFLPKQDEVAQIFTGEARCYPINCGGKIILCTRNLRDALRRIQYFQQNRTWLLEKSLKGSKLAALPDPELFWIDALCIDQDDLQERAAQVRLMGLIYRTAESCLVWLGEDGVAAQKAIQAASLLTPELDLVAQRGAFDTGAMRSIREKFRCLSQPSRFALTELLSRRWLSRVWIVQEAILAREVFTVSGQLVFDFTILLDLGRMFILIGQYGGLLNGFAPSDDMQRTKCIMYAPITLSLIWKARMNLAGQTTLDGAVKPEFQYIANLVRTQEAMDDRDKIYGILEIAEELRLNSKSMDVDYSLPVERVYVDATIVIGRARNDLSFLSQVDDHGGRKYPQLPSWCPDYSQTEHTAQLDDHSQMKHLGLMVDMSTFWDLEERPNIEYIGNKHLVVDGFCCDTVAHSVGNSPQPSLILQLALRIRRSPERTRVESLWRGIIRDFVDDSIPPTVFGLFFPCTLIELLATFIWPDCTDDPSTRQERFEAEYKSLMAICSTLKEEEPLCEPFLPDLERARDTVSVYMDSDSPPTDDTMDSFREALFSNEIALITARAEKFGLHKQLKELIPSISEMSIGQTNLEIAGFLSNVWLGKSIRASNYYHYVTTKFQRFGMSHCSVLEGDEIWILHGFHSPTILRPVPNGRYRFIGETYIQDFVCDVGDMGQCKTRIHIE
ncbi:uncharacterized protein E0L32_012134 [Thyridium curvatum]|uniref:Heterokaryon incompatibility domain-containing protein n=1 Tax=Thyridium curvatum TaxID=1093900 RepID=A0A507BKF0_9PEZI|nr:uncharacterized protein E0L32_012134 [Thyridium curvatum]TPX17571.1 hypothetical protein E0L32_012134 [Thyridium curvatum]